MNRFDDDMEPMTRGEIMWLAAAAIAASLGLVMAVAWIAWGMA